MEPERFFFSTDGTDVHGPVTAAELHQLALDNCIGAEGFLCREGETTWLPFDPEAYRYPVRMPPVPAVPPTPPPYIPPVSHRRPAEDHSGEDGVTVVILNIVAALAAIGAAVVGALLVHPPPGNDATQMGYRFGTFTGALIFITLVPALLGLIGKGLTRVIIRSAGMIVLALLMTIGRLNMPAARVFNEARQMDEQQKEEARKEIATKGYYSGGGEDEANKNIEKLKSQLTDNSESSRIGRDVLSVTSDLLTKVKASDAVEETCKFTLETVKTADDLTAQSAGIAKLRDAQEDVITFLQNYDQHCRDAMAHDDIPPVTQDGVIAGARKGAHVDLLIALWQEKMKLSDDHVARFNFLNKTWGQWELKDGRVLFNDDASLAAYKGIAQVLQDDVQKVQETQKQIFQ